MERRSRVLGPSVLRSSLLAIFGLLIFSGEAALAHARWVLNGPTPPRSTSAGIKTGPCGGVGRSSTPTALTAGSVFTVKWEEVINHPGRFEIYFSEAGDAGWTLLKTVADTQDGAIGSESHKYETQITLPYKTCEDCTLQLIQVMTENPASPSLYYSCADIRLVNGTPSPTPTPTPQTATDPTTCH